MIKENEIIKILNIYKHLHKVIDNFDYQTFLIWREVLNEKISCR